MTSTSRTSGKAKRSADNAPAPSLLPCDPLNDWLASKRLLILAVIVIASVLVRIAYYVEITGGPLSVQHHWDQSDMCYFDGWAREIAAGDWLSRNVASPLHFWHYQVANDYLRRHPEELARLRPADVRMIDQFFSKHPEADSLLGQIAQARGKPYFAQHPQELVALRAWIASCGLLWDRWGGQKRFHQEPLYPYLVALTYKIGGPDVRYVFLWQLLLGVLSNVLIYLIACRYFGATVGAVAGLLAALCATLLYFEMVLLRETLVTFAGLMLVWMAGTAARRHNVGWWMATGAAMGVTLTLKSHFLIFLLGTLALLAVQCRKSRKDLMRLEAAVIVGVIVGLAPLVARNVAVGVSPLTAPGNAGITFIHGNANEPDSDVFSTRLRDAGEIMGQTDGNLLPTVVATLKRYNDAGAYLNVLWEKFAATWHWYEPPDNTNFYYYRLHAAVLRFLPVTFLILSSLSLMGLVLGARRNGSWTADPVERSWCAAPHLYLLVMANLAVLLMFFVRDRYRVPLMAALIPFAALTPVLVVQWLRDGRPAKAAIVVGSVVLLACWTAWPLPKDVPLIRLADYSVSYEHYYAPIEEQAVQGGDYLKAAGILAESLKFEPEIIQRLGPTHQADNSLQAAMGRLFAKVHYRCAEDYRLAGVEQKAVYERARAEALLSSCTHP